MIETTIRKFLRPHLFQLWLQSLRREKDAGVPTTCSICPIALYLDDILRSIYGSGNYPPVYVFVDSVGYATTTIELPQWAMNFIEKADEHLGCRRIKAWEALDVLKQLEEVEED